MNKKIYNLLKNYVNTYESSVDGTFGGNDAIFKIFDTFFHKLKFDEEIGKKCGIKFQSSLYGNLLNSMFNINEDSFGKEGISFLFNFDGVDYTIRFKKFRDGRNMIYKINVKCLESVKYEPYFIYKYLLYCGLEESQLKGSYFTMDRNRFSWEVKDIEKRSFDDIFLPKGLMDDLKLYVQIYKASDRILRYLKVGNPGVGKTESTIVIANELNKEGVTIIKTPICEQLHQKVELANVLAPSLIILDDIDLSLGDRNSGAYSQLLGDFLDVMDGTDKLSKDVGVIATTNAAHLLDLAAQRPGRFDKTLLFNDITEDNIKNIIIKSLNHNFKDVTKADLKLYTDIGIIKELYKSGVSGSHVFNTIKMLKLRYDTLNIKDVSASTIIGDIKHEIKVISEVRKTSYLKEKFERGGGSMSFSQNTTQGFGFDEKVSEEVIPYEDPTINPLRG